MHRDTDTLKRCSNLIYALRMFPLVGNEETEVLFTDGFKTSLVSILLRGSQLQSGIDFRFDEAAKVLPHPKKVGNLAAA